MPDVATMRLRFMTSIITTESLDLSATNYFIRHHRSYLRYNNKVKIPDVATNLIVTGIIQRAVLRLLREDFTKSKTMYQQHQQKPTESEEPTSSGAQFNGKQDSNCRTCTDFKSWSKQQRLLATAQASKEKTAATPAKITIGVSAVEQREDCPLDKQALGVSTWGLLHTMAAFYSDSPTDKEKHDMKTFFHTLSRLYPCEYCAKDFRQDLKDNPVNVSSQKELALWLCKLHNRVNDKLGKPLFDCSRVNERWRDGWLDGSCD